MSDELIFDSERQELRDRKKRWLIPLLVLAGILLAVVIVSLLLRSGKTAAHTFGLRCDAHLIAHFFEPQLSAINQCRIDSSGGRQNMDMRLHRLQHRLVN